METKLIKEREEISDEELDSLTNALKTRYGIDFTNYEKKSLKRGFARVISKNGLGSLVGLWAKVLKDRDFMFGIIDDLLVNLTELFRNPEIWIKLKEVLQKQYLYKSKLKFWHAGCSTGEEIYTMAIVLNDCKLLSKSSSLATDLSTSALAKAMEGNYSALLLRKYGESFLKYFPNGKLDNFFSITEDNLHVKDDLKKHVQFQRHNLAQDGMDKKYDFIFCRNVMIYFDDALKMKVLKLFYDSLEDDGYFIIGYYDMLPEQSKEYFVQYDSVTRIYKKRLK